MSELLDFAIAAHGGMDRWRSLSSLTVSASVGGALWPGSHGKPIQDRIAVAIDISDIKVS
jgi:hypothetical protein